MKKSNRSLLISKKTYHHPSNPMSPPYAQVPGASHPTIGTGYMPQPTTPHGDQKKNYAEENEPAPTAPSLDQVEKVPGYENVTFDAEALRPPPSYQEALTGHPPERNEIGNMPMMTEEQVQEAVTHFVSEHCCYGKKPAREMAIKDISYNSAFHYTLETFGEKRDTAWDFEPYRGQPLDTHLNGPAPEPWHIIINPSAEFKTSKAVAQVPHTEHAKACHDCTGFGKKRCWRCSGMGHTTCSSCSGSGRQNHHHSSDVNNQHHHHHQSCTFCNGSGHSRCFNCSGHGMVTCKTCSGHGQLKFFVKMTVNWTNHVEDFISETANLPKDLIKEVTGQLAFEEQQPRVWPITHFPDPTVNTASQKIVTRHSTAFPLERILQQRHRVRIIPVSEVRYSWKDQQGHFYVYGFENKVYFPDYPQRCCCGCNIL